VRETDLVYAVVHYLEMIGAVGIRINSGMIRLEDATGRERVFRGAGRGTSDVIACLPRSGRFLAVECKVGRNKPTPAQMDFLERVRQAGGIAIVAYDITDVIKVVEEAVNPVILQG